MASNTIATDFYAMLEKVQSLSDMNEATTRQRTVLELIGQITAANKAQSGLVERIRELEGEVASFKNWEAEKARYHLEKLPPGVHVMALKPGMENGEHPHYVCKTCYQRGKKSVLDEDEHRNGVHHLTCGECGAKLQVGHFDAPVINARPRGRGGPNSWMGN